MLSGEQFEALLQRLRAGDESAARECVAHFEPEIRRAARVRLHDPRLRRMVDSIDISQSVFRRFFEKVRDGYGTFDTPEQLLALLVTMTRNRVVDWARRQQVERRVVGSDTESFGEAACAEATSKTDDPLAAAVRRELADDVRGRLGPVERDVLDRRLMGHSWSEIGQTLGDSPEALRKRLERALRPIRKAHREPRAPGEY